MSQLETTLDELKTKKTSQRTILICRATGCQSQKSDRLQRALEQEVAQLGLGERAEVKFTGCHGFCQQGPIVIIEPEGVFYSHVMVDDASEIARVHLRDER